MNEAPRENGGDEVSLIALGTTLLRNRWRIARWALVVGIIFALAVFRRPTVYQATASFMPQGGADASRSGFANIAGQFGVSLPTTGQPFSPDFYAKLLKSRVLLQPITRDTFVVQERGRERLSFIDLFEIKGDSPARRQEEAEALLGRIVHVNVAKPTGVVEVSAATPWRSVSLTLVTEVIKGVNDYNERTRQDQAGAERKFVEGRLAVASADLRDAEDRLESFLRNNQIIGGSQAFDRDRLQRNVMLKQQVYTTLTQALEDARIREVRDTPAIMLFEPPAVATLPMPRGRTKSVLFGIALGGFIGVVLALVSSIIERHRRNGNAEFDEFLGTLREARAEVLGRRWLRSRTGR